MQFLAIPFACVLCHHVFSQDTLFMPTTGNGGIYNTCYATIYDNGGPDSNYANYCHSTITIAPLWVQHVNLYFEEFQTEIFFDSLSIYDGPGTTFPLIGSYSGTELQNQTISSTGTSITLAFRSDDIQTYSGFKILVSCLMGNETENNTILSIWPNPSFDVINIGGIHSDNITSANVIDMNGKLLLSSCRSPINISHLSPGIYCVVLNASNGSKCYKKFIKL